jgi:hypothetical protein
VLNGVPGRETPINPSLAPGIHRPGVLSTDDGGALDVKGRSYGMDQFDLNENETRTVKWKEILDLSSYKDIH